MFYDIMVVMQRNEGEVAILGYRNLRATNCDVKSKMKKLMPCVLLACTPRLLILLRTYLECDSRSAVNIE